MAAWDDLIKSIGDYNQQNTFKAQDLDLEQANKELQEEFQKSKNKRYKANTKLRRQLAEWAQVVVTMWLVVVVLMISLNDGRLSDNVIMTLLGTTTLNVLGLMFIVLKGLFNVKEDLD